MLALFHVSPQAVSRRSAVEVKICSFSWDDRELTGHTGQAQAFVPGSQITTSYNKFKKIKNLLECDAGGGTLFIFV